MVTVDRPRGSTTTKPSFLNRQNCCEALKTEKPTFTQKLLFSKTTRARTDRMSNYSPAYPTNVQVDGGVKDFITKFYEVSDTPGKNQEWIDFFHEDATLVMALQEATGKTDMLKVREGMWEKVQARKHTVYQVFPANFNGGEEVELMLYGDVVYKLKGSPEGEEAKVDWAGRARLTRVPGVGEWKFAYYRVYLQR
ncbi:hypothetical protein DHEL01_v201530 [Diaporthe helianthi]|uniref:SnoaL-like domain-containing protein n=1 Tax=Diaporthe helianthi TaxID=158607 RepID=A0A2P5IC95_DIAHE|nr:hypothetical protein DHEL01_v201530 [Diaporthe helianthi]